MTLSSKVSDRVLCGLLGVLFSAAWVADRHPTLLPMMIGVAAFVFVSCLVVFFFSERK